MPRVSEVWEERCATAAPVVPAPRLRHEPFPLTDIQHGYVFGRRVGLELGGVSSHLYLEFAASDLDPSRLAHALQKVIDRHDMLRAVVEPDGGQRVLDQVPPYRIEVTDLRDVSAAERSRALERIRHELREQVLPVDRWPSFDVRATLVDGADIRLHVGVDLLFVDVRSVFRILDEWRHHYDDPAWSPEPLELTFRDCVLAQEAAQAGERGARAEKYWRARLDDLPPAPDLPLAVVPEQLGRPSFTHRRMIVPRDRWTKLCAAAQRCDLTPAMLLLAAYTEVLRAWSKEPEFTVTVTLMARHAVHPQVDDVLGDFTAPSLLSVTGQLAETLAQRAAELQRWLLADAEHATFNGIRVMRELTRRRGDGRSSMPVVFSSTVGEPKGGRDALSAFGDLVECASRTPQIWLENQVCERAGGLIVTWNAVEGLFPDGVLDAMFDAYRALLDRLADDDAVWEQAGAVVPLPADHAEEQRHVNATETPMPLVRLHDLVARAARRTPDAVAVIADGGEVTFRGLTEQAHRLARRVRECAAPEPGALVAVSMRPGAEQIAALLGVLHAGVAYVAIDPTLPEQRRHALLRRCRVRAMITHPDLRDGQPPDVAVITPEDDATRLCSPGQLESGQGVEDLAYVMFTSGSTGEPKGVMITHRSVTNTIQDITQRFGVTERDRVLALAPTGFDLSVYDIFGVLGAGGVVVVPSADRAADVTHWSELVGRHGVTIWNSVPAPVRMWIDSLDDTGVPPRCRLRLVLMSGDWIPTDLPDAIRAHVPGAAVISLGGATEGSIWSVCYPIGAVSPDWPSIPYGRPLANQSLYVYDRWSQPCPTWVTGEIHIGGIGVAAGYWDDPVRTAERFVVHPHTGQRLYRTGDLGRYLPGGDIEILGREDNQVKINGYRVELGEIEAALARQPGVRQALVSAPRHPQTGQRQIAAYLLVDDPAATDADTLRQAVAQVLPSFMVPSHYTTIERLPLTGNGKINHAALPLPWCVDTPRQVAAANRVEERLVAIWAKHLGHKDFGAQDGFFDVGGDSLHAVGILRDIRGEFGIGPDAEQDLVEALFMNADIAGVCKLVASLVDTGQ